MMSIGQNLDDEGATNDDDEQEAMKRRVAAVWKHRQEKIRRAKEKRRPAFIATLLSCGGGKGRQAADTDTASRPYAAPAENDVGATQRDPSSEVRNNGRGLTILGRLVKVTHLSSFSGCKASSCSYILVKL